MKVWLAKAIEFSDVKQAEIARRLVAAYPSDWHDQRSTENKLTKMLDQQRVQAWQMIQISEVTGYPMPVSVEGDVDWRILLRRTLEASKKLGARDADLLEIAFSIVPVAVVPAKDHAFFAEFEDKLSRSDNRGEILEEAAEGFRRLASRPGTI